MTDTDKVKAVETFLKWYTDTDSEAREVLDQIWYVVMEDKYKEETK